jgi:hypothetical protein
MDIVLGLLGLAIAGAVVTGAARFALPGPDPMPVWLMSVIGAAAIFVGGGIGYAVAGSAGALLGAIVCATLILVAYRRVVQRRGITGPDAQRLPSRGVGVRKLRRRWGIETASTAETDTLLKKLGDLRDGGALTSEEYEVLRQSLGGRG